ncbi:MAG: Asp-tRNA(Asn)/Glu-tRNA(Gln) amidotransferase subunit GatA [Candidatus Riflebacteria bacterium]|nr:Asp-tRNA(Asn)/Glu-tRNA(Gln) amidotransferase subunit GatA [Candidatus Riflebacteria bacterium]
MPEAISALSATELRVAYRSGTLSVREVAAACLKQTERLDPRIKAFLHIDPAAVLSRAVKLDERRAELIDSPLYGIPVALKDNISTAGTPTTCGSHILEGYIPIYDAGVVEGLERNGALPFGKTNLDEFAMGSSTENSAYGPTRNPWDTTRVPGGSSGGSAAAVSARMVPIALGSDTGGSIRQPAALTGVIGLKCTYGLISRYGLVAYASSLDQIGPIARSVEDIALTLEAIAFNDPRDSTSLSDPRGGRYLNALDRPVTGLRAGLPAEFFGEGIDPKMRTSVLEAVKTLEKLGIKVEECSLPSLRHSLPAYYILAPAEASSNLARFDGIRYGPSADVPDIIEQYSATRGSGFGAETQRRILLGTFVLSSGYYDAYYLKAMKVRRLIRNELQKAFEKYDFLISPTTPDTAFRFGEKTADPLQMYLSDICTIGANLAGIPALSIPCGLIEGLPAGMQLWGPHFGERTLLGVAKSYLDASGCNGLRPQILKDGQL